MAQANDFMIARFFTLDPFPKFCYHIRTFSNGVAFVESKSWFGVAVVVTTVAIFYSFVLYRNSWRANSENAPVVTNDGESKEKFDTAYLPAKLSPEPNENVNENDTGYDPSQDAARAAADYLRVVKMCRLLGEEGWDLSGCLEKPDLSLGEDAEWIALLDKWTIDNYNAVAARCAERPECQNGFYPIH